MSSAEELAQQHMERARRTLESGQAEALMADWLDQTLSPHGYSCLHDCRWPGTRSANIDHVVIGPTGVWVIDDKVLTGGVWVGRAGDLMTGKRPLTREVQKLRDQALAVVQAIASPEPAQMMLAIHKGGVRNGQFSHGDIQVVEAFEFVTDRIRCASQSLTQESVTDLTGEAMAALQPRRSRVAARSPFQPEPADPEGATSDPPSPQRPAAEPFEPPQELRQRRWTARRILTGVFVVWVAAGLLVEAMRQPTPEAQSPASVGEPTRPDGAGAVTFSDTYQCPAAGHGYQHVIRWSGLPTGTVPTLLRAEVPEGPWEKVVIGDGMAIRPSVPAGETSILRLQHRATADRAAREAMISSAAPDAVC